jgi:aryl-alcohol dehydrogenase-like predicted oxidoreductase/NADP-dependent 3-hydroxy acid dehydrogenase YdfG
MKQRSIGNIQVSAIGLGGMPMSVHGRPDKARSVATIHAALDVGVTLIDTADAYCLGADQVGHDEFGHNESLIAKALAAYGGDTSNVLVATKGGHLRPPDGSWTLDGRPEYLKEAAKASARRLSVDAIGLYQHHRPDPQVPYADTLGALGELVDEGVVQMVGISNADTEQIRLAHRLLGSRLVAVQNQFSPGFRSSQDELQLCADLGLAFLPWSPLGGIGRANALADQDMFQQIANAHGVSPQQVCLAWETVTVPDRHSHPRRVTTREHHRLRRRRRPRTHRARPSRPHRPSTLTCQLHHHRNQEIFMTILVIVGAGPGLGAAVARRFGAEGFSVAVISRHQDRVDALAADLAAAGVTARGYAADVRDPAALIQALDQAANDLGPVEVLQYSPIPQPEFLRPVLDTSVDDLTGAIEFSVYGPVTAVQQVLPGMRALGRGTVLFVNGGSGARPNPKVAGTSIAFAGEAAYAAMLHTALAEENIHVGQLIIPRGITPGHPTHDPDVLADLLWTMHTGRDTLRVFAEPMNLQN